MNDVLPDPMSVLYSTYADTHYVYSSPSARDAQGRVAHLERIVSKHFPKSKGAEIVDLGCGDGLLLKIAYTKGYSKLTGVDISPSMVELATRRGCQRIVQSNGTEYLKTQDNGSADLIVLYDLIEHLDIRSLKELLDQCRRVTAGRGRVLVHAPNACSPFSGFVLYGDLTHYRAYTPASLRQLAALCGFEMVEILEDVPVPHTILSSVRYAMWKCARIFWVLMLGIERGTIRNLVLTSNLIAIFRPLS